MKYLSGIKILIVVLICGAIGYWGFSFLKGNGSSSQTQEIKKLFPELDVFTPYLIEQTEILGRHKILIDWKHEHQLVKMELLFKISLHEAQNLIKQNDLEIFNLFMKQPSPYPGLLTQQSGRDCPEDFIPQVEEHDSEISFDHLIRYFVRMDTNQAACSQEEIRFVRRHLQQFCKADGIFINVDYQIPAQPGNIANSISEENNPLKFHKLTCPNIETIKNLK